MTDRLSIESKDWDNQTYQEWLHRIKKELKLEDLSDKVLHIDKGVIYDPYKEYNTDKASLKIKKYPSMNMGVVFDPKDEISFNKRLMQLLPYDLRVVRLRLNRIMDWKSMMDGVHMNLVTWIIECDNEDVIASLKTFMSGVGYGDDTKVTFIKEPSALSYILESDLSKTALIKRLIEDAGAISSDEIYIEVLIDQNLLYTIPFLRAIRLAVEKKFSYKKLTIGAFPMIEKLSEDGNQQIIITGSVAMQCGMAGVDYLFPTYDNSSVEMENLRLMLNIQNVMELESYTHKVEDPLSGSYVIDDLTQQYLDLIEG